MASNDKRQLWTQRITDYRNSGMTASNWCEDNEIILSQLRYWLLKFKKENTSTESNGTNWVSVDLSNSPSNTKEKTISIKIGLATIELNKGFDKEVFTEAVKVLNIIC